MNLDKIPKPGTTAIRKRFWDKARDAVLSLQKKAGTNVSVEEQQGQGTVINVVRGTGADCGGCVCIDTVELTDGGSGNHVGNIFIPVFGTSCRELGPFELLVTGVDGSGAVTDFEIMAGGGYLVPPSNPIAFLGGATPIYANCTFICTTPSLPCPTNILVEFSEVVIDCGCVDTGSGTSTIFTDHAFNGNPVALTRSTPAGLFDCGNSCRWLFDSVGGACPAGTLALHYQFWDDSSNCSTTMESEGNTDTCIIRFWLRDGVYTLIVIQAFLGFLGYLVFYGTTSDITLPIANTISCPIAHGGTATITEV